MVEWVLVVAIVELQAEAELLESMRTIFICTKSVTTMPGVASAHNTCIHCPSAVCLMAPLVIGQRQHVGNTSKSWFFWALPRM